MENEWLDLACINHEKYIMHGQTTTLEYGATGSIGMERTRVIEQVLTQEQKTKVDDLFFKQEREMRSLLKSFISE